MANTQDSQLDEILWKAPLRAQEMGGIQTNTGEMNTPTNARPELTGLYSAPVLLRISIFRCYIQQCHHHDAGNPQPGPVLSYSDA